MAEHVVPEPAVTEPMAEPVAPLPRPAPATAAALPLNLVPPEPQSERRAIVSAPVSRSAPSINGGPVARRGTVTLSAAERETAEYSGISETEYARNKLKLEAAKRAGRYGEQG
jgi:hypothetical protein